MALRDTITNYVARILGRQKPETTTDETVAAMSQQTSGNFMKQLRVSRERMQVIKDARDMYEMDPRAKGILQEVARDAVKGGFQLEVDDENAAKVAEALRGRVKLDDRLEDWARLTFRDGDTMLELGVTRQLEIAEITRKPTLQIHRASDQFDRFPDPTMAYWMSKKPWLTAPPKDAIWFAEWQILHARWDHDEGNRYGRPMLAASRKSYKRMDQGELDMAVRRRTRSGLKYVHKIAGADMAQLEQYKQFNKEALDNPFAAVADFFMNDLGDISVLQGDAKLNELDDIKHHIHTFWLSSPIPEALMGYGTDIDFSVIGHQKEQYGESLEAVQEWVSKQFIMPIIELQWLLAGILPDNLTYEVQWAKKEKITAEDIKSISTAALQMLALGIPYEVIAIIVARFLPGIEPEMLMPDDNEPEGDNVERLANVMQQLSRGMGLEE